MITTVWRTRHLIASLTIRQFTLRYRQSFAGLFWALLAPVAVLGVGTVVFQRVAGISTGKTPYALFTLAGMVPWSFFSSGLTFGVSSVVQNKSMVQKLPFPRIALPISLVGNALIDLAIAAGIFVVLSFVIAGGLPLTALWAPLLLLIEVGLVLGIALFGSALNVFARDIRLGIPLLVQMWLLLTPVMYPLSAVPESYQALYRANPMTGLVESFRGVLVNGQAPSISVLLPSLIGAVAMLTLGLWYFRSTEKRFPDAI